MPRDTHRGSVSIERKQLGFGPGLVCSLVSHLLSHTGWPYLIVAVSLVPYRLSTSGLGVHLPRIKWFNQGFHCIVLYLKRGDILLYELEIILFNNVLGDESMHFSIL